MRSVSEDTRNFDKLLIDAINDGLKKVFGENTAKSVVFYIDPNIAVADPDNYARSLQRLFKEGATVVLDAILDNLQAKTGVTRGDAKSFGKVVAHLRKNFHRNA